MGIDSPPCWIRHLFKLSDKMSYISYRLLGTKRHALVLSGWKGKLRVFTHARRTKHDAESETFLESLKYTLQTSVQVSRGLLRAYLR